MGTFAKTEVTDVIAVVVTKMSLVNEKVVMTKLTSLVKLNQLMRQQLLVFDEIFEKTEVMDVNAVVVMTKMSLASQKMLLVNQRTQLVNHVNEKIVTTIPLANLAMTTKLTSLVK